MNSGFVDHRIDIYRAYLPQDAGQETCGISPPVGSGPILQACKDAFGPQRNAKMTPALRGKFYEGVDELFANSALHSKAKLDVAVCGQFYPSYQRPDFALADGGRTIAGSLRDSKIGPCRDDQAIVWAMEPYNTTRAGDIPGGPGSKVLREFVELNNGMACTWFGSHRLKRIRLSARTYPSDRAFPFYRSYYPSGFSTTPVS